MPNYSGRNGHKPSPPEDRLREIIEHYWSRGFNNPEIAAKLRDSFDPDTYGLSVSLVKKKRAQWGLKSARGQQHTVVSIGPSIERIRSQFPTLGSRLMKVKLLREEGIMVPKPLILEYMNLHHPDDVVARKGMRLRRKQFWTVGVNDVWSMDQHDKWRRFQLFLHIGVEPYSGLILWLKIWWTNRNPRLVCGWYCDVIRDLGYVMPLITQSDPGTENFGIANAQTSLRHLQDPTLSATLQHKFKANKGNIKPEIAWRRLREAWSPGFESLLQEGVCSGWYDPDDTLERLVFHYTFIPWLQSELDRYRTEANDTKPRFNRHKVLPHGRPVEIFEHPEKYRTTDFAVGVDAKHLDEVRSRYAPPDHSCFDLVPPAFAAKAEEFYGHAGMPTITRGNVWNTYHTLLAYFRSIELDGELQTALAAQSVLPAVGEDPDGDEHMDLLPYKRFREGCQAIGTGGGQARETEGDMGSGEDSDIDIGELEPNVWTDPSSPGSSDDEF
ncbi:hypothetical protein BC835DRAFT_1309378 [Cytidiella melzeri]|nr:hypothetical protein BC835DRAFT_1309378 [Cytidiella melzeri]